MTNTEQPQPQIVDAQNGRDEELEKTLRDAVSENNIDTIHHGIDSGKLSPHSVFISLVQSELMHDKRTASLFHTLGSTLNLGNKIYTAKLFYAWAAALTGDLHRARGLFLDLPSVEYFKGQWYDTFAEIYLQLQEKTQPESIIEELTSDENNAENPAIAIIRLAQNGKFTLADDYFKKSRSENQDSSLLYLAAAYNAFKADWRDLAVTRANMALDLELMLRGTEGHQGQLNGTHVFALREIADKAEAKIRLKDHYAHNYSLGLTEP